MKAKTLLFLLVGSALTIAQSRATTLPDACGDDKVTFGVTTAKSQPAPAAPPTGQAQIVFAESFEQNMGFCIGCRVTTRVGMDGNWVGGNRGNSYFTLNVAPGAHHLCVGWQSVFGKLKKEVALASLTSEPGKVYYFETRVRITTYGEHAGNEYALELVPLNEDEGRYRIKAWDLATSKPKK
ncbi:MAG: hypothetical protein WCE75_00760 [Terracidiphilus sp.]